MELLTRLKAQAETQKGIALVAVLMFAGILAIIGLAFYSMAAYEGGLYERRRELSQAFCKAESGLERARWVLVTTQSKSDALLDSSGIVVSEVEEIDPAGQVVRAGENLISFNYDVRIRSKGIENGREREIVAVFSPGLKYAVATAQHITFHGGSNDWSAADAIDVVNDVYILGGLLYDHHINSPDWPYKYDWARPDTVLEPNYLLTMANFRSTFEPLAHTSYHGQQFWGDPGGGPWSELPNNSIVYVRGNVNIVENVRQQWKSESVDVTILCAGSITVTNGKNDNDDRLVLIAKDNIIFEGDDPSNSLNAFVAAGNIVMTRGLSGGGLSGGRGAINGMVYICYDIDVRGHDLAEVYPLRQGWNINQRIETITMNGGIPIPVIAVEVAGLRELKRTSWSEVS